MSRVHRFVSHWHTNCTLIVWRTKNPIALFMAMFELGGKSALTAPSGEFLLRHDPRSLRLVAMCSHLACIMTSTNVRVCDDAVCLAALNCELLATATLLQPCSVQCVHSACHLSYANWYVIELHLLLQHSHSRLSSLRSVNSCSHKRWRCQLAHGGDKRNCIAVQRSILQNIQTCVILSCMCV